MKKLILSGISDSAQLKIKTGTLQFLQDANYEAFQAIVLAAIGSSYSTTIVYVLFGVKNSGSGSSYNISAGAVFYAGEIYLVDAAVFTASGSQVGVLNIVVTQFTTNADPVTLTDSSVVNVHNIRKMVITAGTSGSAVCDFSAMSAFSFYIPPQLNLTAAGLATISGTYPNLKINVPAATNLYPALYAGSITVGNFTAGQDYPVTFSSPLATSNYYVMGSIVSDPSSTDPSSDSTTQWTVRARTTNGFIMHMQERGSFTTNVNWEFIIFAK